MNVFKWVSRVALLCVPLLIGGPALADKDPRVCIIEHKSSSPSTIATGEFATRVVAEIAAAKQLNQRVEIVPCRRMERRVVALTATGDIENLPKGEYIVYDPVWLKNVMGADETQLYFTFAHETSHLLNRHFLDDAGAYGKANEAQADYDAACSVARKWGNDPNRKRELQSLIRRIRDDSSSTYPSIDESLGLLEEAFQTCSPASAQQDVIVYYQKRVGDSLRVADALSDAGLGHIISQSEHPQHYKTNTVACTPDVDPDLLRRVVNALVAKGVEVMFIQQIKRSPKQHRIEILTHANRLGPMGKRPLTKNDVAALEYCDRDIFNTYSTTYRTRRLGIYVGHYGQDNSKVNFNAARAADRYCRSLFFNSAVEYQLVYSDFYRREGSVYRSSGGQQYIVLDTVECELRSL